jgi:prepilin-type N-terminal cleavage/methylation domain-containing protein/prepilin-type processing-associated H-X9-DG protein
MMTMPESLPICGTPRRNPHHPRPAAFTLIEMLVVIGIMGILIAILLPTLQKMNDAAKKAKCMSNLRQVGIEMLMYSEDHGGYLFPDKMGWPGSGAPPDVVPGTNPPQYNVWPFVVFKVWNPPIMRCPADVDPAGDHSYIVNDHLAYWRVKYSSSLPNHQSPSNVVLMGEKISNLPDYYMEYGQFNDLVSPYRHGLMAGSNYLFLDLHVDSLLPETAKDALDPWDFAGGAPPKPLP